LYSLRAICKIGEMSKLIQTRCCIAGGGPAGMMLGFLLARRGVDIYVLEKHTDFLRDFRGDTIHASTLEVMYELGILEQLLKRPHQEVRELAGQVGTETAKIADFTHLSTRCKFLAFMPQWDFLNFIVEQARVYPGFHLEMEAEVTDLVESGGRVTGVRGKKNDDLFEIHAALTVGADGRHSTLRERAGLEVINLGAPMDVLWMRLSRKSDDPGQSFGRVDAGRMLILLDRGDYWQAAYVIPKGTADDFRKKGIAVFREDIAKLAPYLGNRVDELRDWDEIKLLTVAVNRLRRWSRPGLLCIGDAAHAMSPIGGVGINLAIQDAVATTNVLGARLLRGTPMQEELDRVQQRRTFPTVATQRMQVAIQNNVIKHVLGSNNPLSFPWPLKLLRRFPVLRRIPARLIAVGFRPEHVRTPA
jgi:2-polyprenyl-6-methoxyphenol hydroxylase-like FAD-dependent oxidoreductase